MTKQRKIELVKAYYETNEQKKVVTKEAAALNEQIKDHVEAGAYGDYLVTYQPRQSETFDWKAAEKDLSEHILQKLAPYWKSSKTLSLYVSRAKEISEVEEVEIVSMNAVLR